MTTTKTSLFIALAIVVVGCSTISPKKGESNLPKDQSKTDKAMGGNLPLASQWIIEIFNDQAPQSISKSAQITISSDWKTFTGNGSCNVISGNLAVKENTIAFSNIIATRMACPEMAQETLFLGNLEKANQYKIVGGELFLFKDGVLLMTLESFR